MISSRCTHAQKNNNAYGIRHKLNSVGHLKMHNFKNSIIKNKELLLLFQQFTLSLAPNNFLNFSYKR